MSMVTINGTTFEGASVLRAVERVAPLPCVGIGGAWYPWQIETPEAYAERLRMIDSAHWDALDRGEIQPGPCRSAREIIRGGWKFLYQITDRGDWNSMCFTVCGGNTATEKGGADNG